MGINWAVRIKNPAFWTGLIAALGTAAVAICGALGIEFDSTPWVQALTSIVTGIFGVLTLVGVTVDPTTQGLADSPQAMTYTEPKGKEAGEND